MARGAMTSRQKIISRQLREKKEVQISKLKAKRKR